ncbi:MAG TPA: general stress protein [Burkholderiaceae bacterium]
MSNSDIAVAVYDSHVQAEDAVHKLAKAGFDMKSISILGKDYHTEEHVVGYLNAGDRAKFFGKLGAFWGGLAGMLFGSALMFVPVVGHIVILGPIAATIAGGLQGAVLGGGASALVGALSTLGIPKDSVLRYETALEADKFLVVVHGGSDDIRRAHEVLTAAGSTDVQAHAGTV